MDYVDSDQAFLKQQIKGTKHEMTYAGALSFLRRKYSRDLDGVDITISGIPFDGAVRISGLKVNRSLATTGEVQSLENSIAWVFQWST